MTRSSSTRRAIALLVLLAGVVLGGGCKSYQVGRARTVAKGDRYHMRLQIQEKVIWELSREDEGPVPEGLESVEDLLIDAEVEVTGVVEGKATGLRIRFAEAHTAIDGERRDPGLAGRTVQATGIASPRRFVAADGGEPLGATAAGFLKEYLGDHRPVISYPAPAEPLAVGASWPIEPADMLDGLGSAPVDFAGGTATGRLVSVQPVDGVEVAEVALELDATTDQVDGKPVDEASVRIRMTASEATDRSVPLVDGTVETRVVVRRSKGPVGKRTSNLMDVTKSVTASMRPLAAAKP